MNLKRQILPTFAAVAALATCVAVHAQQGTAAQRDSSANSTGTATGTNSSTTSNDPGRYTPTAATSASDNDYNKQGTGKLSHRDKAFIEKAAKSGMKEVEVSQAVLAKLSAGPVRDFAQTMINDHQQANQELQALAAKKGVTLPNDNDKWARKWADNDKDVADEYIGEMKDDHKDAVDLFEKATKSEDPDIAAFARKTLPTLQHHLQMLQNDQLKHSAR